MLCLITLLIGLAEPSSPTIAYDSARAVIEQQEANLQPWRLSYTTVTTGGSNGPTSRQVASYSELRKGRLYRTTFKHRLDGTPLRLQHENAFDGITYQQYRALDGEAGLATDSGVDHAFMQIIYGNRTSLAAIVKAADRERSKWVSIEGKPFLQCSVTGEHGLVWSHYLDPENNWQPRRIIMDQPVPPGAYPDARIHERTTFDTKDFIRRGDIVLPRIVEIVGEIEFPKGSHENQFTRGRIELESIEVNPDVADSDFTIALPAGTRVFDRDRSINYVVGKEGSERRVSSNAGSGTAISRALNGSAPWWSDWRIWTAFAALSVTGLFGIAWRQSRSDATP